MRRTTITIKPIIHQLTHASFSSMLDGTEIVIVYAHGAPDRGFSSKLATYFVDELGQAVALATLQWPYDIEAVWFGRRLSESVRREAQFDSTLRDGYYLFRCGEGISFASLAPLDEDAVLSANLVTLGLDLASGSSQFHDAWKRYQSNIGIEPVISQFDAAIAAARADDAAARENERQQRHRRGGHHVHPSAEPEAPAPDPYAVLRTSRRATDTEIKAQFRKLERENHPDRLATMDPKIQEFANDRLREIIEAYNEIKRERGIA